ncbi:RNA-directed DNA polymerase, eukaryota, reverse transcriptase zinc-binding domain protein, partial [Tanacetum coccineum]
MDVGIAEVGLSSDLSIGFCTTARKVTISCTIRQKPLALPWGRTPQLDSGMKGTIFDNKVSIEEANQMTKDVTDEEIKKALFDIDDNKAPGPDGFTSKFYKKAWDIVKDDFCNAIKEFFNSGKMLAEINATLISLVPESMTPQKVSDFRPIACCNVVYKCISKILTNRIKSALTHLVDDNQSAFVPGRAITDNILLTQELLKVSWAFIGDLLEKFGFPKKMRDWIMKCITTPKFTICVNGDRYGYFNGRRGLRQGDPISPYIFTLVMEMLNLILKDEIRKEKEFKYHFGCKQLKITHLCFADDLIMLCHGDITSLNTLKKALDKFSALSGLYPNLGKCTMFCGSLDSDTKDEISNIFPFKEGKLPVRYLGVPLVTKKIGIANCKQLVDKVTQKLNDRKNTSLSYVGRAQLIASVLGSMQVYWGFVFLLPKAVVIDIEKLFKRFLWNSGESCKGKAKVAWKDVCKPKDQGGSGFKSLKWNDGDYLSKNISKKEIFYAGFNDQTKLADVMDSDGWKWPADWFVKYPWISNMKTPILNNYPDKAVWVDSNGIERRFSTNTVWKDVRSTSAK